MLTVDEIRKDIAELVAHGDNRADISTLADLYVCLNAMSQAEPRLSDYTGDSEFAQAIRGKDMTAVLSVLDEAMEAVKVVQPRLYAGVLRKLQEQS